MGAVSMIIPTFATKWKVYSSKLVYDTIWAKSLKVFVMVKFYYLEFLCIGTSRSLESNLPDVCNQ